VLHDLNAAARFADRVALMHSGRLEGVGLPTDILHPVTLGSAFDGHVVVGQGSDGHPVVLPLRTRRS
jgi:iron complex transport system ATP-binding protein